ncbi:MAG: hypothetical protein AAF184_25895, partial [Pseudomonadota bacterium]
VRDDATDPWAPVRDITGARRDGVTYHAPHHAAALAAPHVFVGNVLTELQSVVGTDINSVLRLFDDPAHLRQDVAGTVPVVNDGDPVRWIEDLSGNNRHQTFTDAGPTPVFRILPDGRGTVEADLSTVTDDWQEFAGVDVGQEITDLTDFISVVSTSNTWTSVSNAQNFVGFFNRIDNGARVNMNTDRRGNVTGRQLEFRNASAITGSILAEMIWSLNQAGGVVTAGMYNMFGDEHAMFAPSAGDDVLQNGTTIEHVMHTLATDNNADPGVRRLHGIAVAGGAWNETKRRRLRDAMSERLRKPLAA